MAVDVIRHAAIRGICSAVPRTVRDFSASDEDVLTRRIIETTGVKQVRVVSGFECVSDLCYEAALRLMKDLDWDPFSVDLLVLVTQTPDYKLPATACILQDRLGMSKNCAAFDINLGCSGYIYGLSIVYSLLERGNIKRAILLAGDTSSRIISNLDNSVYFLFGDAGTATAIEYDIGVNEAFFSLHTNGKKYDSLIVRAGGMRVPSSEKTKDYGISKEGKTRTEEQLHMNSAEVINFTLSEVAGVYREILDYANWTIEDVDACVFHQSNEFILRALRNKLEIPKEKMVMAMKDYGNTSSASIPLAITCKLKNIISSKMNLLLVGYGVGLSWGAAGIECDSVILPDVIEV